MMKPRPLLLLFLLIPFPAPALDAFENFLGMRFVQIPAGEFEMGTRDLDAAVMEIPDPEDDALQDETPAHTVAITKPFYIQRTEVTQSQWLAVMENRPGPEEYWQRDTWEALPVVSVSWRMAQRFVEEINRLDDRHRYRLPTEAEWEYVAKGGVNALRPVPLDELEAHAWFIHNSGDVPHPVATRKPNRYGVYDMLGNVWEWVADWYAPDTYTKTKRIDPQGPADGLSKVRRGGSYHCPLHLTRPGYRSANAPDTRYSVVGFRLVAEQVVSVSRK